MLSNNEKFLELLSKSNDKKNEKKMKEFIINFGKDPKPYCPIQFNSSKGE